MNGRTWLGDIVKLYRQHKSQCERAAAQVSDGDFFVALEGNPNSIAVLMKHVGRNHRSRWREFLTTDGEKRDRKRDTEFVVDGESRADIMAAWEEGWGVAFASLDALTPEDLDRTITIRGEPHSVVQAIHRNLNHVAYHAGQIVHLARHFAGDRWETLSIARDESDAFNAKMREKYGDWWAADFGPKEA